MDINVLRGCCVGVQKLTDIHDVTRCGVMATPGVAVDGKVAQVGSLPARGVVAR
ncbi:MAG: thioredoxin family protein [Burkholderiaceae bacterium]